MKLGQILTKIGKGVIKDVVPLAGTVFDIVEEFTGEKYDRETTTGQDLLKACNGLSSDAQAQIFSKELDVEIVQEEEWTKRFQALNQADESGKTSRPKIALMIAYSVCIPVNLFSIALFIVTLMGKPEMVKALSDCALIVLSLIGPLLTVLYGYFGMRRDEKKARYNLAAGQSSPLGVIGKMVSAFKGGA